MTYKYITQETIDSGGKNIKSPEEFAEARTYNMEAVKTVLNSTYTHGLNSRIELPPYLPYLEYLKFIDIPKAMWHGW